MTEAELQDAILVLLGRRKIGMTLAEMHEALFPESAHPPTGASTLQYNLDRKALNRALQVLRRSDRIFYFSPPVGWRLR